MGVSSMASIMCYDETRDVWNHVANLQVARHDAGCAAISSCIYVVSATLLSCSQNFDFKKPDRCHAQSRPIRTSTLLLNLCFQKQLLPRPVNIQPELLVDVPPSFPHEPKIFSGIDVITYLLCFSFSVYARTEWNVFVCRWEGSGRPARHVSMLWSAGTA